MESTSRSSPRVIRETQPGVATGHPPIPVLTLEPGPNAIPLNLKQLVRSRMLIQANSGGGKSHALRSLLELSNGHIQQFVIDPFSCVAPTIVSVTRVFRGNRVCDTVPHTSGRGSPRVGQRSSQLVPSTPLRLRLMRDPLRLPRPSRQ